MPRKSNLALIGQRFGRLIITGFTAPDVGRRQVTAVCDCGAAVLTDPTSVTSGRTASCGCLKIRHGHAVDGQATPTYNSWAMMQDRCRNQFNDHYERYGGRGIKVCARWDDFANFLSDMGERPANKSIDRIDNDGNYEPGNCRWATRREQTINRRVSIKVQHNGETMTLGECCRLNGINYGKARAMVKRGIDPNEAVRLGLAQQ